MADVSNRLGLPPDHRWRPPQQRPGGPLPAPGGQRGARPEAAAPPETEYRTRRIIRDGLTGGELVFTDGRVPRTGEHVDQLVVAASGVWVIDTKKRSDVSFRVAGTTGAAIRLTSAGRDVTSQLDHLSSCAYLVANLVRDPSVPVRPVMAVLPDQCRLLAGLRFHAGRSVTHGRVLICAPKALVAQIRQPGHLSRDQIAHVGHRLDESLFTR